MNRRIAGFIAVAAILAALLSACAQPQREPRQRRIARPDYDMVAAIRAAGRTDHSVVQVKPMRDPATTVLWREAHADEAASAYGKAAAALDQALKVTPDAPDLLQYRAEMAVRLHHYATAARLAMKSWQLGPKVGSLCARNWQTLVEMRKLHGDNAGAASARKQVAKCQVAGVKRY